MSSYKESLSDRQYRLLTILPSPDASAQISCELQLFEIEVYHERFTSGEVPEYEALSYVWGDESEISTVICDGQERTITQNLDIALRRLRLTHEKRIIWADALCINQADNTEKNHQIPLMKWIYSTAKRVIVWLGPAAAYEANAVAIALPSISKAFEEYKRGGGNTNGFYFFDVKLPEHTYARIPWDSLETLFSCTWFQRIWCVQEVQLARVRDTSVLWGQAELTWWDVGYTAMWLYSRSLASDANIRASQHEDRYHKAVIMFFSLTPGPHYLTSILRSCRVYDAKDPRDRVYGVLSLVEHHLGASAGIEVDYSKSVAEVYMDAAIAAIRSSSDLKVFGHIDHADIYDGGTEFSSWTPRWDMKATEYRAMLDFTSKQDAYGSRINARSACDATPLDVESVGRGSPGQIRLKGLILDQVFSVEMAQQPQLFAHPVQEFRYTNRVDQIDESAIHISVASTLTAGWIRDDLTASELELIHGKGIFHDSQNFAGKFIAAIGDEPVSTLQVLNRLSGDDPKSRLIVHCASRVCSSRKVFVTSSGILGLGPRCMRAGDIVAALFGGDFLYILRRKGSEYLLLGEAYVSVYMNGKAARKKLDSGHEPREFCLV